MTTIKDKKPKTPPQQDVNAGLTLKQLELKEDALKQFKEIVEKLQEAGFMVLPGVQSFISPDSGQLITFFEKFEITLIPKDAGKGK